MPTAPNPLRKAAILVASLDQPTADALLEQMPEEQAGLVRRMVVALDKIDPVEQRQVIDEFFQGTSPRPARGRTAGEVGSGVELAGSLAAPRSRARPEPEASGQPPFRFLGAASGEQISPLLRDEHPQTIALVISHLEPRHAARVLESLPRELQVNVLRRLVDQDETSPDILREVERGLQSRIDAELQRTQRRSAGLATVSRILQEADATSQRELLRHLGQQDLPLASALAREPLQFEDLNQFDDESLSMLARAAEPRVLVLALAGTTREFAERWLRQLPQAQARGLRQAVDELGATRLTDVAQAQQELARLAEELDKNPVQANPVQANPVQGAQVQAAPIPSSQRKPRIHSTALAS